MNALARQMLYLSLVSGAKITTCCFHGSSMHMRDEMSLLSRALLTSLTFDLDDILNHNLEDIPYFDVDNISLVRQKKNYSLKCYLLNLC